MNNSTNSDTPCNDAAVNRFTIAVYYYLAAFYVTLGIPCHLTTLITLVMQSKKQNAYIYQLLVASSETIACFTMVFYAGGWFWMTPFSWFRKSWWCQWFTTHCSLFIITWFTCNSNLMTLAVTVDRSLALWKPNLYRTMNHSKWQKITCVVGLGLTFCVCVYETPRYSIVEVNGEYVAIQNLDYAESAVGNALNGINAVTRGVISVLLIVCSVGLIYLFRKYSSSATRKNRKNQINDKVLITLTFSQCIFNITQSVVTAVIFTVMYGVGYPIWSCPFLLVVAVYDTVFMSTDLLNCYCCLIVSPGWRSMIRSTLQNLLEKPCQTTLTQQPATNVPVHPNNSS